MFEQRQHDRAEEKTAVNMALSVLSKENPALLQMHHTTVAKRVLKKARAVAQGCPRCHQASLMLRQKASNLHSELLATAAMTTGSGEALVPVVGQLNDLVRRIDEQQKAEEEHKEWCEHELSETAKTKAHHEMLVEEFKTRSRSPRLRSRRSSRQSRTLPSPSSSRTKSTRRPRTSARRPRRTSRRSSRTTRTRSRP